MLGVGGVGPSRSPTSTALDLLFVLARAVNRREGLPRPSGDGLTRTGRPGPPLAQAYETCARLARDHYDNFRSPRCSAAPMRPHVAAVYAFARVATTSPTKEPCAGERSLLDDWPPPARMCGNADRRTTAAGAPEPDESARIFLALGATSACASVALFDDC